MIQLTDTEKGKLIRLAQDKVTLDGLRKIFLKSFLADDIIQEVNVLAASRLAIKLMEKGFNELTKLQEDKRQDENLENPAI